MEIIKMSAYEKAKLYRVLEKQKTILRKQYKDDEISSEMYEMELQTINTLIERVNGNYKENVIIRKMFGGDYV